jgi:hypothetical protein
MFVISLAFTEMVELCDTTVTALVFLLVVRSISPVQSSAPLCLSHYKTKVD